MKQEEVERIQGLATDQAHESTKRQVALTTTLAEAKEGLGRLAAENESTNSQLHTMTLDARMQKREAECALREASQERTELEERIASLKTQLDHQAKMSETKLAFAQEQSEAKLAMREREHEAHLTMKDQEAQARLERAQDEARQTLAAAQADWDQKRRELEGLIREANQARKEQADELEWLHRQVEDKNEAAKKLASMSQYHITAISKARDRVNLEKDLATQQTAKTIEESEMMRRVLESALRESDDVAKSLRE